MSPFQEVLRKNEDDFIEFLSSDIHKCDAAKNDSIIYYVTPDKILKQTTNIQSIYGFSGGTPINCCQWCGYSILNQN